jgi:hypothetical protein
MRNNLPPTAVNPVSLLGAVMAIFSLVIIVVLLILGATGTVANPYTGILAFMVGPAVLVFGLLLIPIGIIRERRRRSRYGLVGETFPVLNLNDPGQRRALTLFSGVTASILLLMTVTTWGAAEYMESTEFCGKVCHKVMQPEDAAYEGSPHARVHCVSCHIGPGAPWLVRSKISGIRQVFAATLNTYPRPIPVPIEDLRPSRDTCEQCHWPERFYGDRLRNFVHYAEDEQNTLRSQPLVFRVGGSELGAGIHWHTTASLWYLPLDEKRQEIGWVKVEKPDGSVDEYVLQDRQSEVTPQRVQQDQRFMDCIDCHNRTAHHFEPIPNEIDRAMYQGSISADIPFIKQQAIMAIGEVGATVAEDRYNQALARIDSIDEYYRTQHPDVYSRLSGQIEQAVAEIREIYERSVFPHMNVTPETYPEWRGHDGCFRCHGKLVGVSGSAAGQTVSSACLTCHYPAQVAPPPPGTDTAAAAQNQRQPLLPATVTHPVQGRENCAACHMPGAPGAGAPGGLGMPEDHRGRANESCLGCHAVSGAATPASPAPAPPPAGSTPAPGAQPSGQPTVAPVQPTAAPAQPGGGPAAIPHPVQGREQCSTCHTAGGPGAGSPGGLGMPADHQGRPDASCAGCHRPA